MSSEVLGKVRSPALYARVSSEDQVSGTSLDDQVDKCLKQAAVYGWTIPPERIFIDDGYTGSTLERPAMARLRAAVATGEVDCVIVYKLDRLSRNIRDTVNLVLEEWSKTHRVIFRSVTEDFNTNSPLGTLIFSILASFAHFERDVIRDRTENGRRRRFAQGRRAVANPPYGYSRGEIPGTMVIDEEQAKLVRKIFDLYLRGYGFAKIAGILNAAGHRTSKGADWTDSQVRDIAINEVYLGKVKYSGEYGPGQHEPIIDQDTFAAVQELRRGREKVGGRSMGSPFLLAGMIRCKGCGHMMFTQPGTISRRKRKDGTVYTTQNHAYYLCGGRYKKGQSFCTCGHIRQDGLEEHVIERLRLRFGSQVQEQHSIQVLQREIEAQMRELGEVVARMETAIAEKQAAVGRWESAFERGELSAERFGSRVTRLELELAALVSQKAEVEAARQKLSSKQVDMDWYRRISRQIDTWGVLTDEEKRQLVQYLIERVEVWKDSPGRGKHRVETETEVDIVWNRLERALPEGDLEPAEQAGTESAV